MHRRSLKFKVMAALFSAAFLLGAVDAGASMDPITVTDEDQTNYDYAIDEINFTGRGILNLTQATLVEKIYFNGNDGTINIPTNNSSNPDKFKFRVGTITGTNNSSDLSIGNRYGTINVLGTFIISGYLDTQCLIYNVKNINATVNIHASSEVSVINSTLNAGGYINMKYGSITNSTLNAGSYINVKNGSVTNSIINASNVTIAKDLTFNTNYIQNGYANLNGGLNMINQKITSLGTGNVADASTDAVNGAQLYTVRGKISSSKKLSAGKDVSISSADAISVNKAGKVAASNTGIATGNTVYTVTGAIQSSLDGVISSVKKNATSITSLQDGMADLKKSVTNINSTVASTTKNLSSGLSNRLQTDLGNLSDDGKSVIKNLIAETLRSMNVSTASVVAGNEASLNTASVSPVSIMPATADSIEMKASVTSADVDDIYNSLVNKVGKTDFETVKTSVDGNASAIAVNAEGIKANVSAIDTLKTSKANIDGSNLDVGTYSAKLGIGKIGKDSTGLVNGGAVYSTLDQKANKSYVDAGLGMMVKQLDSAKQTVTRDINRMGANAAALASLHPQNYDPADKLDFAAGYGHYHDSNATAVGAFYRPNASTMVSLASTIGNGDSMVSVGLSFKLGMNDKVEKIMITKSDFNKQQIENQAMKGHLDNQTARLQQMEAALSVMISH